MSEKLKKKNDRFLWKRHSIYWWEQIERSIDDGKSKSYEERKE
jgi:hypothetical protein